MAESILRELKNPVPSKDDQRVLTFQKKGYLIFVGQNAYSNERIISQHPHRDCLWVHAMAARGSHVIVCIHEKAEPSEEVIQYAARLALRYSHSEARTVSMALLKDLHKNEGNGVGVFKAYRSVTLEAL